MRFGKIIAGALVALGLALPTVAAERAVIVLDGSGSMWAQVDGTPRITIARDTLAEVLGTLPGDIELGLMTYGHREKGNCDDIQMLVAPARGTAAAINTAAGKINPKGMTPLSDAVRLAAEELRYTEDAATVILITDGLETCEVDPCLLGSELEQSGVNFTTHVLGFGLSDEEGRQVACLAENTGGQYLSANDGAGLVKALSTAVAEVAQAPEPTPKPTPPSVVVDKDNLQPQAFLAEGVPYQNDYGQLIWELRAVVPTGVGDRIQTEYNGDAKFEVEPGEYYLRAIFGGVEVDEKIVVPEGAVAKPELILNAGLVRVRTVTGESAQPNSNTQIRIYYQDDSATQYGTGQFRLPAGPLRMEVTHDSVVYSEEFELAAGEILDKDVNLNAGYLVVSAIYAENVDVTSNAPRYGLQSAKKSIDGRREEFDLHYGNTADFYAVAGEYIVETRFEGVRVETPVTITADERTDLVVNLNAGVAAFTAPGAERLRVFEAKVGIDGSRNEVDSKYANEWQYAFASGDYVVEARMPDGEAIEVPFSVIAGERVEVEVTRDAAAAAGIAADKPAAAAPAPEVDTAAGSGEKKKTK